MICNCSLGIALNDWEVGGFPHMINDFATGLVTFALCL